MKPAVIRPDEARTLQLYDVAFRWGIGADQTDGQTSVLEVTIPPRTLIKPHVHSREDEYTVVLDGPIGVRTGDDVVEEVPAGSWLVKPRSVPHAMWNLGERPARVLEIVVPGGLERYFEQIEPILRQKGPEWTARYRQAADDYGLEILDDWTDELKERYGITL